MDSQAFFLLRTDFSYFSTPHVTNGLSRLSDTPPMVVLRTELSQSDGYGMVFERIVLNVEIDL